MKPCIHPGYRINAYAVAILSVAANVLLAVLVLFRTSSELKKYNRVLLCTCLMEVLFASTAFLADAHLSFRGGILFMVVKGHDLRSYEANFAFVMFHIYMLYATLAVGCIALIFRHFSLHSALNRFTSVVVYLTLS